MRIDPRLEGRIVTLLLWIIAALIVAVLVLIVGDVLVNGVGQISWEFLTEVPRRMGKEGGIYSSIVSTVVLVLLALLIAAPLGVGAAIFLVEYRSEGPFLRLVRFTTECLAGIPSIIYGVFGYAFFVLYLNLGWSVLSGGLTLSLMVLPIIVRTSEEALIAIPLAYREGSLALGATRAQTVVRIVLPAALPGILTGVILSAGRAVGESAAVILTAGAALGIPRALGDPGRSMSVHLYLLSVEGVSMPRAYATGAVLIIAVMVVNLAANWLSAMAGSARG